MGNGMRVLKALTIGMGVLILAGTGVLVAVIGHRLAAPAPAPSGQAFALALDEPAGTHIAGVAALGDRLAVALQGGGSDRVVLVDPRSGAVVGRVSLAH